MYPKLLTIICFFYCHFYPSIRHLWASAGGTQFIQTVYVICFFQMRACAKLAITRRPLKPSSMHTARQTSVSNTAFNFSYLRCSVTWVLIKSLTMMMLQSMINVWNPPCYFACGIRGKSLEHLDSHTSLNQPLMKEVRSALPPLGWDAV